MSPVIDQCKAGEIAAAPCRKMPEGYFDAHHATVVALDDLYGLAYALGEIAGERSPFSECAGINAAIWALINQIEAQAERMKPLLEAQWIAAGGKA